MKKLLTLLLAAALVTAAGLSGCNNGNKDTKEKPAAADKAKEDSKDKAADTKTTDSKKDEAAKAEPKTGKSSASIKDFGDTFCSSIKSNANSFGSFLAIRPLMRIGLELEFSKDPETKKQMAELGMDIEKMVDMGIKESGLETMEFPMMEDIGACKLKDAKEMSCDELAKDLATNGMMGEDLIPEEITRTVLDAYKITECGSVALEGDDGVITLGLLNVDGEWKMITLWE